MKISKWLLFGSALVIALVVAFWNPARVKAGGDGAPS